MIDKCTLQSNAEGKRTGQTNPGVDKKKSSTETVFCCCCCSFSTLEAPLTAPNRGRSEQNVMKNEIHSRAANATGVYLVVKILYLLLLLFRPFYASHSTFITSPLLVHWNGVYGRSVP